MPQIYRDHRKPDGDPMFGIIYGLNYFMKIKGIEKDNYILKIVLAHNNNDYTSTYTQVRKIVLNKLIKQYFI
ncbi:MAG: hypothetical protein ACTHKK_11145 [Candidatus Nitrosocosmicus sp.]